MMGRAGAAAARRRVLVVLALLTGNRGGAAAQPPDPAASGPAVRLFTGARVIVGDGRVIEDAAFLVRGDLHRPGRERRRGAGAAGGQRRRPDRAHGDTGARQHPRASRLGAVHELGLGELHPREPRRPSAPPCLLRRRDDHLHRQRPRGDRPRGPAGATGGRGRRRPLPGVARDGDPRRRTEPPIHERRRVVGAARGEQPRRGARGGAGRGRARHPDPEDLGGRARRAAGRAGEAPPRHLCRHPRRGPGAGHPGDRACDHPGGPQAAGRGRRPALHPHALRRARRR